MRRLVLALSMCSLVACGNETTGDDGPADAPTISGEKYELKWGPVTVQPSQENTQCVVLKLPNTAAIKVHQLHNILGPGSHHLIVYRDDMSTAERTTPFDCQPFTGALNPSGSVFPMMITQKADDLLTLPDKVAYTLKAGQFIRIEMHYINSTDNPITAQATTEFYAVPDAEIQHEANILFIGTPDIDIAAGATVTVNQFFTPSRAQLDLTGAKFFAITGHTHQYGTDMQVGLGASNGGPFTSVYAPKPFVWSEPETRVHNPEFTVPSDGGFDFKCVYHNTSAQRVQFGESANQEMCFFWAYYYPSHGARVCAHTSRGGGLDVCCPGHFLCGALFGM